MCRWQANFQKWNGALQTKDAKAVASMYSESDLSFLPTVSHKHISKLGCTEEYFENFVMKDPFGTITDDSVQVYESGNAYLHSGLYTFDLGEGGARAPTEARFSYMWRKENDDWKITHHHSSVRPEPKAPTQEDMLAVARVCPACLSRHHVRACNMAWAFFGDVSPSGDLTGCCCKPKSCVTK